MSMNWESCTIGLQAQERTYGHQNLHLLIILQSMNNIQTEQRRFSGE
jgi:hypothetical protein